MTARGTWAAVLALSVGLAACGGTSGSSGGTVTLEAGGTGERAEVAYRRGGETVTETVDLPWSTTVEVGGDWDQELVVTNLDGTGSVSCSIVEEAFPRPVETDGEAAARCTASVAGDSADYETEGVPFDDGATPDAPPATDDGEGDDAADDGGDSRPVTVRLSDAPLAPARSQVDDGTLWAIDGSEVVAVDLASGDVRRLTSTTDGTFDTLAVGAGRVAAISGRDLTVHAGRTDGDRLLALSGLPDARHLAVAADLFWVSTGAAGVTLHVVDARGAEVATFTSPEMAPAVVADTGTGAFAIDYYRSVAYFIDLETEEVSTVTLPEGAEIAWAEATSSTEVVITDTAGVLAVISATGDSEVVLESGADRVWSDGDGGIVVSFDDGTFARFDPADRSVGEPVALPGPERVRGISGVAGVGDGAVWFWTDDYQELVGADLDLLG